MGIVNMGVDFAIAISCVIGLIVLGISLTVYNHKLSKETHAYRMQVYRQRKRIKNEALRQALGIPKREQVQNQSEVLETQTDVRIRTSEFESNRNQLASQ